MKKARMVDDWNVREGEVFEPQQNETEEDTVPVDPKYTNWSVLDNDGDVITEGVQAHEIHSIAQELANDRGESVWIYPIRDDERLYADEDGEEIEPDEDEDEGDAEEVEQ